MAGAIADVVGSVAIDRVVDGFVTPAGLRMMLTAGRTPDGPITDGRFDDVRVDVERHGPSWFTALVERWGNPDPGAPPLRLRFVRDGLSWKLASVKLRSIDVSVAPGDVGSPSSPVDVPPPAVEEI